MVNSIKEQAAPDSRKEEWEMIDVKTKISRSAKKTLCWTDSEETLSVEISINNISPELLDSMLSQTEEVYRKALEEIRIEKILQCKELR